MRLIALFVFLGFVWACTPGSEKKEPAAGNKTQETSSPKHQEAKELSPDEEELPFLYFGEDEFKDFYTAFFVAFSQKDYDALNSVIHPKYGLNIIETRGAMPQIVNVKDISEYKLPTGQSIFEIDMRSIGFEMLEDELPVVKCDEPNYFDKLGAFTSDENLLEHQRLIEHIAPKNKEELLEIQRTIRKTVYNTANYVYYFSFIDGRWYLTFLDVRRPCEA
jgi:DNA-directed RNA polymerase subunit E'/Rpb7